MPNPIYAQFNRAQQGDMGQSFMQFMAQSRGKDPRQIINQMVQSGQLTQQQLNVAQQRAQQMSGLFSQFKNRFGF